MTAREKPLSGLAYLRANPELVKYSLFTHPLLEEQAERLDFAGERRKWLQARQNGVGSSDIGVLLGVSPFGTKEKVMKSKLGEVIESEPSFAMQLGVQNEVLALSEFVRYARKEELQPGFTAEFFRNRALYRMREFPFALATPDAFFTQPNGGFGIVECKVSTHFDKQKLNSVTAQTMWQMMVTGAEVAYVSVLHPKTYVTKFFVIVPDAKLMEVMIETASEFWTEVEERRRG